jgi:hypothetical protein
MSANILEIKLICAISETRGKFYVEIFVAREIYQIFIFEVLSVRFFGILEEFGALGKAIFKLLTN